MSFILRFFRQKASASTAFSEFIRNASAGEKKRVYAEVLEGATKRQNALFDRVARPNREAVARQH